MQTYQQDFPWLPLIKLQSPNPNFYILSCLWFLPVILFLSLLFTLSLQKLWFCVCVCVCVCVWVHTHAQLCLALCNPMDCSPLASSVHGIFQARILEWVAFLTPGDLPNPGIKPVCLVSLALQEDSLTTVPPGKPWSWSRKYLMDSQNLELS